MAVLYRHIMAAFPSKKIARYVPGYSIQLGNSGLYLPLIVKLCILWLSFN